MDAKDTDTEIAHQRSLLAIHRGNVAHYLEQVEFFGGDLRAAPPPTRNGLASERQKIAEVKAKLRSLGATVDDQDGDTE